MERCFEINSSVQGSCNSPNQEWWTCLFWKDKWSNQILEQDVPESYSFAKNKNITIHAAANLNSVEDMFNLPLSQAAFNCQTFSRLWHLCIWRTNDIWSFFGGSSKLSSSKAYKFLIGHGPTNPIFTWLWDSPCQPKHKVFCWLLLKDKLSTRNILRKKNIDLESFDCALCQTRSEETLEHLFLHYPFTQQRWNIINLAAMPNLDLLDNLEAFKVQFDSQFFMVAIILMSWTIGQQETSSFLTQFNAAFRTAGAFS